MQPSRLQSDWLANLSRCNCYTQPGIFLLGKYPKFESVYPKKCRYIPCVKFDSGYNGSMSAQARLWNQRLFLNSLAYSKDKKELTSDTDLNTTCHRLIQLSLPTGLDG